MNKFLTAGAYVAGIAFGIGSVLGFRAYVKDERGDKTLKMPVGLLVVAALALALPSYLGTGLDTVFGGSGGNSQGVGGVQQIR
jgi:hypothetical protein